MYKTGALLRPQHFSEVHKCRTNGVRKPRAAEGGGRAAPALRRARPRNGGSLGREHITHRALQSGPCSIEGAGRGLQEAVGSVRGAAPLLAAEGPNTSTDRWAWAPGAQGVFQVRPSTPGPEEPGDPLLRRNWVSSSCPRVGS